MVETNVAVVHGVVADLSSQFAHLDSHERNVGVQTSDGNQVRLHSIIIAVDDAASKYDSVGCVAPEHASPDFGGALAGRVDNELVRGHVERGCGLKTSDIRAVGHFRLDVAAENLQLVGHW